MNRICLGIMAGLSLGGGILAPQPPLLPEKDVRALANELSGEMAKRNLEVIATAHRQRGSQGFHAAAEFVTERLRAYGLSDLEILQFPADGKIFYGTQRSRPAWDAEFAELRSCPSCDTWVCHPRTGRFQLNGNKRLGFATTHQNRWCWQRTAKARM